MFGDPGNAGKPCIIPSGAPERGQLADGVVLPVAGWAGVWRVLLPLQCWNFWRQRLEQRNSTL